MSEVIDDGLTDEERAFLKMPVIEVAPEQRHILVQLHEKRALYNYAQNEEYRKQKAAEADRRFA